MSSQTKFMVTSAILLIVINFTCARGRAQENQSEDFQPGKTFATVAIATNAVEYGLTQTDSTPALRTQLGYKWTYFRMGLYAGNVKYGYTSETMNLRLFADYKFIFSRNANLVVRYDLNRYYTDSHRDGAITSADLNLYEFHVTHDRIENWEGTNADNRRYGFYREFEMSQYAAWSVGAGYNMLGNESLDNYFDIRSSISYKVQELKYELIGTYNSQSAQFNGRGGTYAFLQFSAVF